MARNGSGTYSLLAVTAPANTVSSSTTVNNNMNDIATALTESINKDGTKAWAANQSVGGFKFTSQGDGSARTDSIALGQVQDGKTHWIDGGGTADAITATYAPAITVLVDGQICFVRATAANTTTTPTFAPNGLTARTIVKTGGVALAVGDIVGDNHELILKYFLASTRWELLNPGLAAGAAYLASANNFTATQTITSTDAGAGLGPILILDRNSATPATNDGTGQIIFRARDSGGNVYDYATIENYIGDVTNGSEDGFLILRTGIGGTLTTELTLASGALVGAATGGNKGVGTANATEYYKNGVIATRTLIATLTTTSGTTHSVTDIPAYRELYIEVAGVSFTAGVVMNIAVSADNGSNYGTARAIAPTTGAASGALFGNIRVGNLQVADSNASAHAVLSTGGGVTTPLGAIISGNAGAFGPYNAIQFSGGTFDAGTIRVYGLL